MDYSSRKIHLEIQLIETLSNFYGVNQLKRQNFSDHYLEKCYDNTMWVISESA